MDPNNNSGAGAPPPFQPGSYDFITNPAKPPKKGPFAFITASKSGLLMAVGAGLIVIMLFVILYSVLFGGTSNRDVLLSVARQQSKVIALSEEGAKNGGTSQTQGFAIAVQLSVETERNQMITLINKSGKVKTKDFSAGVSAEAEKKLETAQNNGRYDEEFINLLRQELANYQRTLETTNTQVSGPNTKALIASTYANTELLLDIKTN